MVGVVTNVEVPRIRAPGHVRATGLAALLFAAACATTPPLEEIPSAESYYNRALEVLAGERVMLFFRDIDYQGAIELFQEVIDNYPYSEYATLAELKIADVYYDQEKYEEAASYYQDFVELHPTNLAVPYAIYRNGLCAFERLREPDRDQTPTHDAIAQFRVLLDRYPDSEYAAPASGMLARAEDQLADHDIHIGDYYLQRRQCHSAIGRYRSALVAYPHHTRRLETMFRLGQGLSCMGETDQATDLYRQVLGLDPGPELAGEVHEELHSLGIEVEVGRPVPETSAKPWWRPF